MNCFQNNFRKLRIFRSKRLEDHFLRNFPFHQNFLLDFLPKHYIELGAHLIFIADVFYDLVYIIFLLHCVASAPLNIKQHFFAFLFQSIFWPHCIVFLPIFLYTKRALARWCLSQPDIRWANIITSQAKTKQNITDALFAAVSRFSQIQFNGAQVE